MSDFLGFQQPTTTPVPDEVFDALLPQLSEAELKVLLYIIRRTLGFGKNSDDISLSQIESGIVKKDGNRLDHGTGLSRRSVIDAIESLVSQGIIKKQNRKLGGLNAPSTFTLAWRGSAKSTLLRAGVVQNLHGGSVNCDTGVVQNLHPQETVLQETDEQETGKNAPAAQNKEASTPDAENAWDAIKGELEFSITPSTFRTWVIPAKAASLKDGTLTLVAPTSYAQDWLTRLRADIERAARSALPKTPIQVVVITGGTNGRAQV